MKKLLVAISLLLVVATVMVVPAFGAKAVDVDDLVWNVGQPVHKVETTTEKAPKQDGVITKNEYTYTYSYTEPLYMTDRGSFDAANGSGVSARTSAVLTADNDYAEWHSESMTIHVSYDADYIYLAIVDDMFYKDKDARNNDTYYGLNLGFDINDPTKQINVPINGSGSVVADNNKVNVDGVTVLKCEASSGARSGDDSKGYVTTLEYKFNKADVVKVFNAQCGTDFAECPNMFYINVHMRQYSGANRYALETLVTWFGKKLTNVDKLTIDKKWNNVPAIVALGATPDAEETTTPATTEPATTEPAATTPAETTPAETTPAETTPAETTPAETTPAETTPAESETEPVLVKKGCGGSITAMGVALVAVMGMGAVVVSKKKED